jgi:hypothetical protein
MPSKILRLKSLSSVYLSNCDFRFSNSSYLVLLIPPIATMSSSLIGIALLGFYVDLTRLLELPIHIIFTCRKKIHTSILYTLNERLVTLLAKSLPSQQPSYSEATHLVYEKKRANIHSNTESTISYSRKYHTQHLKGQEGATEFFQARLIHYPSIKLCIRVKRKEIIARGAPFHINVIHVKVMVSEFAHRLAGLYSLQDLDVTVEVHFSPKHKDRDTPYLLEDSSIGEESEETQLDYQVRSIKFRILNPRS